jgi:hypothetical protein
MTVMKMAMIRRHVRLAVVGLATTAAVASLGAVAQEAQAPGAAPAAAPANAQAQPQAQQRAQGGGGGNNTPVPAPDLKSGKWTGGRLADGQPDVEGFYSNIQGNHASFTRPGRSRVTDPADGQLPLQPWAEAKVKEFRANFSNPSAPQFIEPLARCAPGGVPKSFLWHGHEIRQFPGYVVVLFGSGTRIIHLDGKPHLPDSIKLWNADSRGHWEGNTLVVDVTNNNSKALFGRSGEFTSENVHIEERWIFDTDAKRYNVKALFTDPEVYTRPWTATIPMSRRTLETDKPDNWHFIVNVANDPTKQPYVESIETVCTENNGGFGFGATSFPSGN